MQQISQRDAVASNVITARYNKTKFAIKGILSAIMFPAIIYFTHNAIQAITAGSYMLTLQYLAISLGLLVALPISFYIIGVCIAFSEIMHQQLLVNEEPVARYAYSKIESYIISQWNDVFSRTCSRYLSSIYQQCEEYETEGIASARRFMLKNLYIPQGVRIKETSQISPDIMRQGYNEYAKVNEPSSSIIRIIRSSVNKKNKFQRRIAVLGPPGTGKTTLLRHLALIYASYQHRKYKLPWLLPIIIVLRDASPFIVDNPNISVEEIVRKFCTRNDPTLFIPKGWIERRLRRCNCLLLLDGLDEIADEAKRFSLSDWIDNQIKTYPDLHIILTSRPLGYRANPLKVAINTYEIQDYSLEDMKRFVRGWYVQHEILRTLGIGTKPSKLFRDADESANSLIAVIINNRPLRRMALNPLLLTMIVNVHANRGILPKRRIELYKEVFEVLLTKRQQSKKIDDIFSIDQKLQVLKPIALWLMLNNQKKFTADEVRFLVQPCLNRISSNPIDTNKFLIYLAETSGLISPKEAEGRYEFSHMTFQEYLASCEIIKRQKTEIIVNIIRDPSEISWWSETIRFCASQMDASEIVQAALSLPFCEGIQLAFECINDCLEIDPIIRLQFQEHLELFRESSDHELRKIASSLILRTEI